MQIGRLRLQEDLPSAKFRAQSELDSGEADETDSAAASKKERKSLFIIVKSLLSKLIVWFDFYRLGGFVGQSIGVN